MGPPSAPATSCFFSELMATEPFFLLAGPNVIESSEHVMKMARQIKSVTDEVGMKLVFKSSFDKANRTSARSFRGPGLLDGLKDALAWVELYEEETDNSPQ